ncbi:MAG: PQQ-binding-like beta-propeller repeat protein [Planctomycetes bacterium]|nr:PQQ-binding-like beta-propeller repeat protein [Planctomycetota bacterium]
MTIAACVAIAGLSAGGYGADWPQWGRTVNKNMAAPDEKNLPTSFDPGKFKDGTEIVDMATTKNIRWVAKMGSLTYGNPTVANGRVYVGTNNDGRGDDRFKGDYSILRCLDEKTGKEIWTLTVPKLGAGKVSDWEYLGIASSAAIDGDRVYIVTNKCQVLCLDANGLANGNQGEQDEGQQMAEPGAPAVEVKPNDADIIWHYDMRDELGVFPHNITSSSPLVIGDLVYVSTSNGVDWSHTNIPNPKAPCLIALDKNTGELKGEEASGLSQRIFHGDWTSPCYGEVNGKGLILYGGPDGVCYAFDPIPVKDADGYGILKEVWRYDCNPPEYRMKDGKPIKYTKPDGPSEIISTPVFHDGKVYVGIGQDPEHGEGDGNFTCIDPTGTGDVTKTKKYWSFKGINRSLSTPAIADGLVFMGDFSGFVYCFDASTGELYWKHDSLSHIWGSALVADGKVYIGNEDGDVLIFAASKDKKELGRVTMPDPVYSTPICANGVIYLATSTQLYAIESK